MARCVALLGMMATHVLDSTTPTGEVTLSHEVFSGRASALFAVLAGVSLALVSGRREPVRGSALARVSVSVVVRAVPVAVIGLLLGRLDSGLAIILTYYAVMFVLAVPFLGLTWRPLLALAVGWAVASPVVSQLVRPELPPRQFESPRPGQLDDPGQLVSELLFTGYYPAVPWLAYLLLGLAIGRLDLRSRRVAAVLAGAGLATAVASVVVSDVLTRTRFETVELDRVAGGLYGQAPFDDGWRWLLVTVPHSTTPFDLLQTGGSAALAIAVCLLVVGWLGDVWEPGERAAQVFFGAGAMTLSLYSLHVVMRTDRVWPPEEPSAYVWHVLVVLTIGAAFASVRRRGPLEWLVGWVPDRIRRGTSVPADGT